MLQVGSPSSVLQLEVEARRDVPTRVVELPPEVLRHILMFCDCPELIKLSSTCHQLYEVVQDDAIWRNLAKTEYHVMELTGGVLNTYKKLYQRLLHPYGWMIGLYLSKIDYFGGLIEIKLSGDSLVAISLRVTQEGVLQEVPCFEVCCATQPATQICTMIERPHDTHISLCKDGESLRQKCQFHDTKFAQGHYNYNTLDGFRAMTTIDAHRLGILHQPLSVPSIHAIPREMYEDTSCEASPQKYSRGITGGRAARAASCSSQSPKRSAVQDGSLASTSFDEHRRASSNFRRNDNYYSGGYSGDDNDAFGSNSNSSPSVRPSRRLRSPFRSSPSTASLGDRCRPAPESLHDEALPSSSGDRERRSHSRSYSNDSLLGDNFKETTDRIFEDIVPHRDQNGSSSRSSYSDGGSGTSTLVYNLLAELGRKTDNALNNRMSETAGDVKENDNERDRQDKSPSLHSSQDDLMDEDLMNCSPSGSSNTFSKSSTNESISTASNSSTDSSTTVRESTAQANGASSGEPSARPNSPEASSNNESRSRDTSPFIYYGSRASPFYMNSTIRSSRRELALLYRETHCSPFPPPCFTGNFQRSLSSDPWLDSLRYEDTFLWEKSQQEDNDEPSVSELPPELPPHVLKPGLYYGHYGAHGYEIVMLEYRIREIVLIKVLGDQYVPTREVTVRISLPFSFTMSAEEQRIKSCSDLLKVELESSKLPFSHYKKQPFLLPPSCSQGIETKIPSTCWARYHGLGQLANLFHSQPRFARVHVMVFNNEEFGVLFLSLKTFMMFRRINRDFPKRAIIDRPDDCSGE
ncbi:F-box domain [Trinorchestia longiramus]|nr:F-box domain [Trinorchestia longiramus]